MDPGPKGLADQLGIHFAEFTGSDAIVNATAQKIERLHPGGIRV